MAINYASQFAPKVAETFTLESLTQSASGQDYQFTGTKAIKVLTVDTVPLGDYQQEGMNRYGTPVELGDVSQELVMGDDKAFTMTIDKGNSLDQMNLKGAAEAMKRQVAQVVVPYIDRYRLKHWAEGAGLTKGCTVSTFEDDLLGAIFDAGAEMDNAGVPQSGRTLFLPNKYYKKLALSDKLVGVDKLGENALAKGIVGEIDGMTVKRVPDRYLPDEVLFLAKHKNASADPVKLQEGKIHKDPPGLSGNLLEGRIYQDSFVLHAKSAGIYAAIAGDKVGGAVTITLDGSTHKTTMTAGTGNTIKYTTDGSDPRYSDTAVTYGGTAVSLANGTVVKATSVVSGYSYFSVPAEKTISW